VVLDLSELPFAELCAHLERTFRHIADAARLGFRIELDPRLPRSIYTDGQRLQQILKNLLSNAFKFTHAGEVRLRIAPAGDGWRRGQPVFGRAGAALVFEVSDTGIGIPADKQKLIFEAFQQADGTTSRKYGGTGLGLSICRELARLLGGEIRLESVPDEGSAFTLYLPQTYPAPRRWSPGAGDQPGGSGNGRDKGHARAIERTGGAAVSAYVPAQIAAAAVVAERLVDDRAAIRPGDRVLLIVEDDSDFAQILVDLAHEYGCKAVLATHGAAALALSREFDFAAVMLDIILPEITGWTVLDQLKRDPSTRHVPVHILSIMDEQRHARNRGASSYLIKPVSLEMLREVFSKIIGAREGILKHVLVVEDDPAQSAVLAERIESDTVQVAVVGSGQAALDTLDAMEYDCLILDLGLPDMTASQLVKAIAQRLDGRMLPIIVYTARDLHGAELTQINRIASDVIVKDLRSLERLLDATACVLYGMPADANGRSPSSAPAGRLHGDLAGKKVLIVDDDVRNIYALTGVLEDQGVEVVFAENGQDGIDLLRATPGIDLVLMDVMMPQMDGYETMQAIRKMHEFKDVPIVALTAKAMKGDREQCIEAGASDYIAKPVDPEQLFALLRGLLP
jgi:CheY-like chemotaxis protein/two-component sensor histidine kinase